MKGFFIFANNFHGVLCSNPELFFNFVRINFFIKIINHATIGKIRNDSVDYMKIFTNVKRVLPLGLERCSRKRKRVKNLSQKNRFLDLSGDERFLLNPDVFCHYKGYCIFAVTIKKNSMISNQGNLIRNVLPVMP
ncbi:MAG: hypothetical protein D3923_02310 [Candidatus Electrothrix sp. AR3]|nr:hypothetical protein [Candidatus Electrothrix sp. AR3]